MSSDQQNLNTNLEVGLSEVARYYSSFPQGDMPIWKLSDRGFLFEAFRNGESDGVSRTDILKKIENVSVARKSRAPLAKTSKPIEGRLLALNPSATMYDGLTEQITEGFFDADDVPPPEFWVCLQDELLISFVPNEFFERANTGVENCMSGCLEWLDTITIS